MKLDVPKPQAGGRSRNAKEVDNFLFNLERYFEGAGIEEDAHKVSQAPLYLSDSATTWWRMKHAQIERGTLKVETWAEFKRLLKAQFYPRNVELEAREKLRKLTHKGDIRDYVREFTDILLEIPNMPETEAMYVFLGGLQSWAKLELQRRNVEDLNTAIAEAESLAEYQRKHDSPNSSKQKGSKDFKGKGGGASGNAKEGKEKGYKSFRKAESNQGGGKNHGKGEKAKPTCFLCQGPHKAFECPMRNKIAALCQDEEKEQREDPKMSCMQLLSAVKASTSGAKVEHMGRMYAKPMVQGKESRALIDTGATHNFIKKEEAQRLGIQFKEEQGWLKAVNSDAKPIFGVARGVELRIGDWQGKLDFSVVPMDDFPIVLGMLFLDQTSAVPVPCANTMILTEGSKSCVVPVTRFK